MGSSPNGSKDVLSVGFFFLSFLLSFFLSPLDALSLTGCLLAHAVACFTMGEAKERNHIKNPSIAICEANTDVRAMCGKKGEKLSSFYIRHRCNINQTCLQVQTWHRQRDG